MAFWKKIFTKEKEQSSSVRAAGAPAARLPQEAIEVGDGASKIARARKRGIFCLPYLTEKTNGLGSKNQYAFRVASGANKTQVKQAIAARYGVIVKSVRVLNMPAKERRRGQQIGWKPGFKKAIVRLEKGQEIQIQ